MHTLIKNWSITLCMLMTAISCSADSPAVPDTIHGRVLETGSRSPVANAKIDVEICTRVPRDGMPGPEGVPHSVIWAKRQATSQNDGSFDIDLRSMKNEAASSGWDVGRLTVRTVGVKAPGFQDQRVAFVEQAVTVYLVPGTKREPESSRFCH
jgi:hypothetical protein